MNPATGGVFLTSPQMFRASPMGVVSFARSYRPAIEARSWIRTGRYRSRGANIRLHSAQFRYDELFTRPITDAICTQLLQQNSAGRDAIPGGALASVTSAHNAAKASFRPTDDVYVRLLNYSLRGSDLEGRFFRTIQRFRCRIDAAAVCRAV
jgi:hypothetical protein